MRAYEVMTIWRYTNLIIIAKLFQLHWDSVPGSQGEPTSRYFMRSTVNTSPQALNDTSFDNLEWPLIRISRSLYFSKYLSNGARQSHSYY